MYKKWKFIEAFNDYPNKIQCNYKKHIVWYNVVIYGKNGSIKCTRNIKYDQHLK